MSKSMATQFRIVVDGGKECGFESSYSQYDLAVLEAFGALGLPYPCEVKIWCTDLVEAGYGPYFYRIDGFIDMAGNHYGCPAVMHSSPEGAA